MGFSPVIFLPFYPRALWAKLITRAEGAYFRVEAPAFLPPGLPQLSPPAFFPQPSLFCVVAFAERPDIPPLVRIPSIN